MSKKANRVCKTCQTAYYFCPTCSTVTAADKYKKIFCSKNCRDIFQVVVEHNMKNITKDEANLELSKLDLSSVSTFAEQLKTDVNEIMKVCAPVIEPIVESVVENDIFVAIDDSIVSIDETAIEPIKKHKRAKKHEDNIDVESIPE